MQGEFGLKEYSGEQEAGSQHNDEPLPEQEGVIKFCLEYIKKPIPSTISIELLDRWRHVLYNLELIGQQPDRYEGLGYGNISCRLKPSDDAYLISGSQTGHLAYLKREHLSVVTYCDPEKNTLKAYGECIPSSESLTHGVLYQSQAGIGAVVHVHCPLIWQQVDFLNLPATSSDIPYGTPEMAKAVVNVAQEIANHALPPVFVMKGHVDGVVSFGSDFASAVMALLDIYNQAVLKPIR